MYTVILDNDVFILGLKLFRINNTFIFTYLFIVLNIILRFSPQNFLLFLLIANFYFSIRILGLFVFV